MSEQQPNPANFSSFTDWCLHKDTLSEAARHTVEVLLKEAGTSDINTANRILSRRNGLKLDDKQISDITPLQSLTNLTELKLECNEISDITPLQSLTNLTHLTLRCDRISDLTPMQSLTNLTSLDLSGDRISDLTPLQSLTNLTCLWLSGDRISDLTPLQSLTNLTELNLFFNNQISDITPLQFLTNLTALNLYHNNQISDLTPLQSLTNLTHLTLHDNRISDITPLQSLTNLTHLTLFDNQISDIRPLQSLTNLTVLCVNFTPEQKALIEECRHSWESLANSTKPIDAPKATAAVKAAYDLLGLEAPEITFCSSPNKALAQIQMLQTSNETEFHERLYKQVEDAVCPFSLIDELGMAVSRFNIFTNRWGQLEQQLHKEFYGDWKYSSSKFTTQDLVQVLTLLDFYVSGLGIVFKPEAQKFFEAVKQLLAECGWIFAFENVCYVCSRPCQFRLDSKYRLHAEAESALEFPDGYKLYSYHGVTLPEKYGQVHPDRWQAQWILDEENAEIRRVLIERIGYDRICQQLQAVELDSWQEYTLLKIDNADIEPIYLLKMTCPSTGFIHALRVPPNVVSAQEAIRWVNWDVDSEEFSVQT
jgi:Leucine Rich repeats (2 copies)